MTTRTKGAKMGTNLGTYIRETVKQDVRLFLAPIVGAVKGIRQEVKRVQHVKAAARKKARI